MTVTCNINVEGAPTRSYQTESVPRAGDFIEGWGKRYRVVTVTWRCADGDSVARVVDLGAVEEPVSQ